MKKKTFLSLENQTDVYVTFVTGNDLRNNLIMFTLFL